MAYAKYRETGLGSYCNLILILLKKKLLYAKAGHQTTRENKNSISDVIVKKDLCMPKMANLRVVSSFLIGGKKRYVSEYCL